jgi:hypothetical protein
LGPWSSAWAFSFVATTNAVDGRAMAWEDRQSPLTLKRVLEIHQTGVTGFDCGCRGR